MCAAQRPRAQELAQAFQDLIEVRISPSLKPLAEEVSAWAPDEEAPSLDGLRDAMCKLRDEHATPLLSRRQFYSVDKFRASDDAKPVVTVRRWRVDDPVN